MYDIYVIRGNAAVFKCHIPSFVSDHVRVVTWHDTDGGEYIHNDGYGIFQCLRTFLSYILVFLSTFTLNGFVKLVDLIVAPYFRFSVVSQSYTVNLVEENVLRGNAAILKCLIPSFVTEYVSVASWIISDEDEETEIKADRAVDNEGTNIKMDS